jgi:diguanylate cyclase (GGDEF)-like protein
MDRTVILFEDGPTGDARLFSALEATLRHATEAHHVVVARSEAEIGEHLISSHPVLLVVDGDLCDALRFERIVASLRSGASTRWLPAIAMVSHRNLATFQEALGLPLVDFILKPVNPDELWGRIRIGRHNAGVLGRLERRNEELARRSITDSLTGLYNVTHIIERCDQEIGRARRYGQPVSCLLVDIDGFKAVNDTFGHPVGNEVLRGLAGLLRENVRGSDIVGRYGGEEFLMVLPATDLDGAMALAERLRRAVEECAFQVGPHQVKVTVSIGAAVFPGPGVVGRETLFLVVDRAVYRAKTLGRNRVAWLKVDPGGPGTKEVEQLD